MQFRFPLSHTHMFNAATLIYNIRTVQYSTFIKFQLFLCTLLLVYNPFSETRITQYAVNLHFKPIRISSQPMLINPFTHLNTLSHTVPPPFDQSWIMYKMCKFRSIFAVQFRSFVVFLSFRAVLCCLAPTSITFVVFSYFSLILFISYIKLHHFTNLSLYVAFLIHKLKQLYTRVINFPCLCHALLIGSSLC